MQFSHGHQLSLILLGWTPCQTKLWFIPDSGYSTTGWRDPGAEHGEIQCAFVVWVFPVDLLSWLVEPCGNPLLPILVEVGLWNHAILAESYGCVEPSFHGVEPSRKLHSFSNLHYIILFFLMYYLESFSTYLSGVVTSKLIVNSWRARNNTSRKFVSFSKHHNVLCTEDLWYSLLLNKPVSWLAFNSEN